MHNILLIDGDVDTMSLMQKWLERKGYNVKYTSNISNVLPIIEQFSPDVVIIDVLKIGIAEKLELEIRNPAFKILLMTGHTLNSKKINFPLYDTIEKPFDLVLLENHIRQLINS